MPCICVRDVVTHLRRRADRALKVRHQIGDDFPKDPVAQLLFLDQVVARAKIPARGVAFSIPT